MCCMERDENFYASDLGSTPSFVALSTRPKPAKPVLVGWVSSEPRPPLVVENQGRSDPLEPADIKDCRHVRLSSTAKMVLKVTANFRYPKLLVASTPLINVGVTLTATRYAVVFDSEWLARNEQQAKCRVRRMGQDQETFTIRSVNKTSRLKIAIGEQCCACSTRTRSLNQKWKGHRPDHWPLS